MKRTTTPKKPVQVSLPNKAESVLRDRLWQMFKSIDIDEGVTIEEHGDWEEFLIAYKKTCPPVAVPGFSLHPLALSQLSYAVDDLAVSDDTKTVLLRALQGAKCTG